MSKIVSIAEKQIIDSVTAAVKANIADGTFIEAEIPAFKTEIPADRNNGDYSANAAFMLSKALRMPPRKIAEEIESKINLENTYFEKCEIAGPGFINFFLKNEFYADVLSDIDALGDNYGKSDFGNGKKINVEFVSANPTGDLHLGHARQAALGDSICRLLEAVGFDVEREYYINDAGNQIHNLALSLKARYNQLFNSDYEMPEDGYHGPDVINIAKGLKEEVNKSCTSNFYSFNITSSII